MKRTLLLISVFLFRISEIMLKNAIKRKFINILLSIWRFSRKFAKNFVHFAINVIIN